MPQPLPSESRSERLTILVSPRERSEITERANRLGVSAGELLRLAFRAYDGNPRQAELELLTATLEQTVAEVRQSLEEARAEVAKTLRECRSRKDAA